MLFLGEPHAEKPADHQADILCHFVRTIGLYRPFKFLYGTANNTVSLALGRRADTSHSANCRISICTALAIHYIGSTSTAILGALEPVTALFFGVLLFHEKLTPRLMVGILMIITAVTLIIIGIAHKKDGNAVADEQKIIYFCYLINQNAILNLKKYGRRKDLP